VNPDFRVGSWLVRPSLNAVSQNGTSVRLEPKVMEVLVCLTHGAGEPVTKEELLRTVWPDTFVSDDVLKRSISELRRVFGDDARESRIIETIPKRGYRLVARVESVNGVAGPMADIPTNSGEARRSIPSGRGLRIGIAIGVAATAALLLLLGFEPAGAWRRLAGNSGAPQIRSIAVLPLKNLSDDPSQKYFAYGMAEELITDLSQMSSLKVISHTSANRYQDSDKPIPQIARELSVDAVVGGAVQRSGDRVRVTAQLIYAPQDSNLWAKTYDGDVRDVLALQSRIAREVADEIQVKMTPEQSARLTKPRMVDPKSLDAYWKGQYHLSLLKEDPSAKDKEKAGQEEEFRQAVSYFEEAIRQDPNYAPAYLGYADSVDFFQNEVDPSATSLQAKGRSAVMKALALDDTLANAHLHLADILFYYDWNWAHAEREYQRAVELSPNSADAHCSYAGFLNSMGRLEEGLKQQEMQLQLDPDLDCDQYSPLTPLQVQIEREQRFIETHHRVTPEHYWDLGLLFWKAGRYKEASAKWEEMMARLGYTDVAQAIGRGYTKDGYHGALREWARTGEAVAKQRYVPRIMMAYIYGVLGDNDRAFAWLEKAYVEHESSLPSLKVFLAWDPIRSDPRFAEMIRRVGLPR